MKRLARGLFNSSAVISLFACLLAALGWARSRWQEHGVLITEKHGHYLRLVGYKEIREVSLGYPPDLDGLYPRYDENAVTHESWPPGTLDGAMAEDWGNYIRPEYRHAGFGFEHSSGAVTFGARRRYWIVAVAMPDAAIVGVLAILPLMWTTRYLRQKRRREGVCMVCGYDLRATRERCPECGTVPSTR